MKLLKSRVLAITPGLSLIFFGLSSCASPLPMPSAEAQQGYAALVADAGQGFRSKPYLELAMALQALPREQAIGQLQTWAKSEKNEQMVIVLCRLLWSGQGGEPLTKAPKYEIFGLGYWKNPFQNLFGIGGTHGSDWPDWPLAMIDGVPFWIEANRFGPGHEEALAGPWHTEPPPPLAQVYLNYCLKEGRWTSHSYKPMELAVRQRALDTLLKSPAWKRPLRDDEIKFLSNQITETADPSASSVAPLFRDLNGMTR